jgi:hypothetical protein
VGQAVTDAVKLGIVPRVLGVARRI